MFDQVVLGSPRVFQLSANAVAKPTGTEISFTDRWHREEVEKILDVAIKNLGTGDNLPPAQWCKLLSDLAFFETNRRLTASELRSEMHQVAAVFSIRNLFDRLFPEGYPLLPPQLEIALTKKSA